MIGAQQETCCIVTRTHNFCQEAASLPLRQY